MQIVTRKDSDTNRHSKKFELGETLNAGDPVYLYDDAGTPKVKKVSHPFGTILQLTHDGVYPVCCKASDDIIVVFYRNLTDYYGWVVAVDVSDPDNPIEGTPVTVVSIVTDYLDIANIGTNKFVCTYRGTSYYGQARVGTVNPTTLAITLGTESQFSPSYSSYSRVCRIEDDKFAVSFKDNVSMYGAARIGGVSGTTITWGTMATFYANRVTYSTPIWTDTPSYLLVAFRNVSGIMQSVYSTVTGLNFDNNPFIGTTTLIPDLIYNIGRIVDIGSLKYVVSYTNSSSDPKLLLFTKTGYTVDPKDTAVVDYDGTYYSVTSQNDANALVFGGSQNSTRYRTVEIPGIDLDDMSTSVPVYPSSALYADVCVNIHGSDWQVVATWSENLTYYLYVQTINTTLYTLPMCIGILEESGVTGELKEVTLLGGRSKALTGYNAGDLLYIQSDLTIDTTTSEFPIAIALSNEEALIGKSILQEE